ncbi:MAG: PaaI family thioesterase [Lachnospiraceae bacterium]|nr:PaaI family thioesterase [Lachnospiraceae bacterium]
MKTIEEIREFFGRDRFACGLTGIYVEEASPGYGKVSLRIEDKHLNGSGRVMGGVYFTLADLAVAVATNQDFDDDLSVALTGQISFIGTVTEGMIYAEANVRKDGRKIIFCDVTVTHESGKLLATSSMSSYRLTGIAANAKG